MKTETKSVEVYSGSFLQAELLKSVLENAGIVSYLKDEIVGTLAPWVSSPGGAGPVKVVVADDDYEKTKGIVKEFEEKNTR
jgi:hypothetical protein